VPRTDGWAISDLLSQSVMCVLGGSPGSNSGTVVIKVFSRCDPTREYILIDRNDHYQEPNTETRDPTASPKIVQILRAGLESSPNEVDYTTNNDSYQQN
jgi:hypothetical protein